MTDYRKLIERLRGMAGATGILGRQGIADITAVADALEALTTPLPDERLDAIEAKVARAVSEHRHPTGRTSLAQRADDLYVAARDAVPALLVEVRRLRAENAALGTELAEAHTHFAIQEGRLRALSSHPDEEMKLEWAEFDADDIQEDGSIHEWAEPKDIWDKPLPADELAELRAEGGVYATRRKPDPWLPVPSSEGSGE